MNTKKLLSSLKLGAAATAVWSLVAFSQASPVVITNLANSANFNWSFASAAGTLSGTGNFLVTGWGSNQLDMQLTLNNSSTLASNRLTSFGFGIDPNVSSVGFADDGDGGMIDAIKSSGGNTDIPSLTGIEVCAWGGQNCSGGGNGGIDGLSSDIFHLLLNSATTWGNTISIDPIGFKYQTGQGSFEFTTGSSSSTSSSTSSTSGPSSGQIPEPSSSGLVFLGLGLLTASFWARRSAAKQR